MKYLSWFITFHPYCRHCWYFFLLSIQMRCWSKHSTGGIAACCPPPWPPSPPSPFSALFPTLLPLRFLHLPVLLPFPFTFLSCTLLLLKPSFDLQSILSHVKSFFLHIYKRTHHIFTCILYWSFSPNAAILLASAHIQGVDALSLNDK